jgi:hypothetical protein
MSNERYTIETHKIITSGIERVEFDPSKVRLMKDADEVSSYHNEAERFMFYKYEDIEVALKIYDLGFSLGWGKTKVEGGSAYASRRDNVNGLSLFKRISTKLRKRPNKDEYSQASLDKHKKRAESLDQYDLNYAKEQFALAIKEFNEWYVEEQIKRTVNRYSDIGQWKFDTDKVIVDMNQDIADLSDKIKELKQKRFDKKCELVLNSIESKDESINGELRQPLIEEINKQRGEGYKGSFFL